MTVGVIASAIEENMSRPTTTTAAEFGELAGFTESPEMIGSLRGSRTEVEAQFFGLFDNLAQGAIADIAPGIGCGGKGGTAFDRSVGLDTQCRQSGTTALPECPRIPSPQ